MSKRKKRGLFIVFEGIDGSGKSTQAKRLYSFARRTLRGKVYVTEEPTHGVVGECIREILKGGHSVSSETLQILFSADRAEHMRVDVMPRIKKNMVVVSDRSFFSTLAYSKSKELEKRVWEINRHFLQPDIVFWIDVPVAVALKRVTGRRNGISIFEKQKELKRIRKNYATLKKRFTTIVRIDGDRGVDAIHADIIRVVQTKRIL